MIDAPLVSILVPARDEAADIGACLDAVLAQDHPRERLEVVVVDGGSTDATVAIAGKVLANAGVAHQVITNPVGTTPSNLNVGLARVHGEVVCRVDARSVIPPHYARRCAEVLAARPDVVVVGGAQVAVARDTTDRAVGIARALNNKWGMGGSRYRRGASDGPSDTVYLGAFRTAELRDAGGWDERFTTNQDYELNRRMGERGTVWFDASLEVGYRPRATLRELFHQYRRFGEWKVAYWRETSDRPQPRQLLLLAVPPTALAGVVVVGLLPTRLRRTAIAAAAVGAVTFETTGSAGPPGRLPAHVMSGVASVVVASSWFAGVVRGSLEGRR
jgi:glycosyltransferase involved in cell wall biosynthesis